MCVQYFAQSLLRLLLSLSLKGQLQKQNTLCVCTVLYHVTTSVGRRERYHETESLDLVSSGDEGVLVVRDCHTK